MKENIERFMLYMSLILVGFILNVIFNYYAVFAYYFYDNNADWTGSYHEYNDDVEVITAVEVYATEGFPRQNKRPHERKDDEAKAAAVNKTGECKVTFSGACGSQTQQGAIAKGDSRIFWVKWKTPKIDENDNNEYTYTINVRVPIGAYIMIDGGQVTNATITCKVYRPKYPNPPDTNYDDEDGGYITSCPTGRMPDQLTKSFYTYTYKWVEDWHHVCTRSGNDVDGYPEDYDDPTAKNDVTCMMHVCPDDPDHECPTGDCTLDKQDWGEVVWEKWEHQVILQLTSQKLQLADNTPFPEGYPQDFDYDRTETVRSGYGLWYRFNCSSVYIPIHGNPEAIQYDIGDYFTHPQVTMYYYPEFSYDTYADRGKNTDVDNDPKTVHYGKPEWHTMENDTPENPYSHFNERCHYVPIWYPDGEYEVLAEVSSCFSPGGELTLSGSQYVIIKGSLWDDLHIRQTNKLK
ncbi:MAG: hypothetical protein IJ593_00320 [Lachnospiraceae bacterium]|nr:hypothetical protein [Lachnospiraceae bacterium]